MFESWYLVQKFINIGENLVLEVVPAYLLEVKKNDWKRRRRRRWKKKQAKLDLRKRWQKTTREIRPDAKALAKIVQEIDWKSGFKN